ncbi:MAG: DciA family protein [Gaiellaceae bacterium]
MDRLGEDIRGELARFGPQAGMAELLEQWPAAVGDAIARNAWPARIAKDGTVHVSTADSVWAFELGHRAQEIAERLGVPKLRFAPGPLPQPADEAPPPAPQPTPQEEERARALASRIEDENLRESVQKAVRLSLARERHDRRV